MLKTATKPVIMDAPGMIKNFTDNTLTRYLAISAYMKYCSSTLESIIKLTKRYHPRKVTKP